MFDIVFYKNRNVKEPVLEYIQELSGRSDKDNRIKLRKVHDYINHFVKKTRKIPQNEVEQAKRNLADFKERYSHE